MTGSQDEASGRPDGVVPPEAGPSAPRAASFAGPASEPITAVQLDEPTPPPRRGRSARQPREQAGMSALDQLLLSPQSVDSAADDFFDGLVRRVEGDR
jgi:hypothetical protein